MKVKKCSHCKKWLPIDDFYKNKTKKDGYCNACKECMREYQRKYLSNPENYKKHLEGVYRRYWKTHLRKPKNLSNWSRRVWSEQELDRLKKLAKKQEMCILPALGSKCEVCYTTERLLKHHVSYYPLKIVTLCGSCHAKLHSMIGKKVRLEPN